MLLNRITGKKLYKIQIEKKRKEKKKKIDGKIIDSFAISYRKVWVSFNSY